VLPSGALGYKTGDVPGPILDKLMDKFLGQILLSKFMKTNPVVVMFKTKCEHWDSGSNYSWDMETEWIFL